MAEEEEELDKYGNPKFYRLYGGLFLTSAMWLEPLSALAWNFYRKNGQRDAYYPFLPLSWKPLDDGYPTATPVYTGWSVEVPPPPTKGTTGEPPAPDYTPPTITFTATAVDAAAKPKEFTISMTSADTGGGSVIAYYMAESVVTYMGGGVYQTSSPDAPTAESGWYHDKYTKYNITGPLYPQYDIVLDPLSRTLSYKCDKFLYAWAMDSSGNITTSPHTVEVTISMARENGNAAWPTDPTPLPAPPDKGECVVGSFVMNTESNVLTVPIHEFTAGSWCGIKKYAVTESSIAPVINSDKWVETKPTSYSFSQVSGTATAYAWAMDGLNRISAGFPFDVAILLDVLPTMVKMYVNGRDLPMVPLSPGCLGDVPPNPNCVSHGYDSFHGFAYMDILMSWDFGKHYTSIYSSTVDMGGDRYPPIMQYYPPGKSWSYWEDFWEANQEAYFAPYPIYCDEGRVLIKTGNAGGGYTCRTLEEMKYKGVPDYTTAWSDQQRAWTLPILSGTPEPGLPKNETGHVFYCDGQTAVYLGNNRVLFTISYNIEVMLTMWQIPNLSVSDPIHYIDQWTSEPKWYTIQVTDIPGMTPGPIVYGISNIQMMPPTSVGVPKYYPSNHQYWESGSTPMNFRWVPSELRAMFESEVATASGKLVVGAFLPTCEAEIHTSADLGKYDPNYSWPTQTYLIPGLPTSENPNPPSSSGTMYMQLVGRGNIGCIAICEGTLPTGNDAAVRIEAVKHNYMHYYTLQDSYEYYGNTGVGGVEHASAVPNEQSGQDILAEQGEYGPEWVSHAYELSHWSFGSGSYSIRSHHFAEPIPYQSIPEIGRPWEFKLDTVLDVNTVLGRIKGHPVGTEITSKFYTTHAWACGPPTDNYGTYTWVHDSPSYGGGIKASHPPNSTTGTYMGFSQAASEEWPVVTIDRGATWTEVARLPGMTKAQCVSEVVHNAYPFGGKKALIVHAKNLYIYDASSNDYTLISPLGYDDYGNEIDFVDNVSKVAIGTRNVTGEALIKLSTVYTAQQFTKLFMSATTNTINTGGPPIGSVQEVICMAAGSRDYVPGAMSVSGTDSNIITVTNPLPSANVIVQVKYTLRAGEASRLVLITNFGLDECYHASWMGTGWDGVLEGYTFTGGGLDPYYVHDDSFDHYEPPLPADPLTVIGDTSLIWYETIAEEYQITTTGGYFPITFELISGTLPPGMTMTTTGLIEGTPSEIGSYDFTVRAADSRVNTAEGTFHVGTV